VLETAGIPTAVICSDEFGPLGRAEAEVLGLGALPLLPIPHPLAGNDSALVRAKAEAIADEVLSALTDSAAALAARHGARFLTLTDKRMAGGAVCTDEACVYDPGLSGAVRP
jgi:hypothetical protein